MRVMVYPADRFGCGMYRMIWPAEVLKRQGYDVEVVTADKRNVELVMDGERVADVIVPDVDVVVFQRLTHAWLAQAVGLLHDKGITTVVDVDDNLSCIHPNNPAFEAMHPRNEMAVKRGERQPSRHSWANLATACRNASLVTVSTPRLLNTYARHGRGAVLQNYLPDSAYVPGRVDHAGITWPASLQSHPNDPDAVGGAISRLVQEGATFEVMGESAGAGAAFGLPFDPPGGAVHLDAWPARLAQIGIGIAPLADTEFNRSKSWLKPLELSAAGVPWVASPRVEYQGLHDRGAGILADTPRRWYRELARLRDSESARQELSLAGREAVKELRIETNAWRWMEAWTNARAHWRPRTPSVSSLR